MALREGAFGRVLLLALLKDPFTPPSKYTSHGWSCPAFTKGPDKAAQSLRFVGAPQNLPHLIPNTSHTSDP
jgi:hypothetical protein